VTRRHFLAAATLAFACARTDAPSDPVWGREPCAHCRMIVSDKRYAAQLVASGERHFFDDVGCMVLWLDDQTAQPERLWVRLGDRWTDAVTARYADGAKTPMDFGFEAAEDGGVSWSTVKERVAAKRKERR
jgi:hypothetical protein